MIRADIPTLVDRLNDLADHYRVRPPGERSLTIWYDGLRTFPIETVADVLLNWPRHGRSMPTLADCYPRCEAIRRAQAQQRESSSQPLRGDPPSEAARLAIKAELAALRELFARGPRDPHEWIRRGLARIAAGARLPEAVRDAILTAAESRGITAAPLSDAEREAQEERLAIMAESGQ